MGWGLSPARSSQARPLAVAAQARYLAHQDGGRGELIDCMRVGLLGACSCSGMCSQVCTPLLCMQKSGAGVMHALYLCPALFAKSSG
eukprot:65402-Pelagomonas_calceolata.AAC.3